MNNVVMVSGGQQRDHAHMCVHSPQTPLMSRLPHKMAQSSLCHTGGRCWLSILNTAVCTGQSQTP